MAKRQDESDIHTRQIRWCWIIIDPFFPKWVGRGYVCPLCGWETYGEQKEIWLRFHKLLGRAREDKLIPIGEGDG